MLSKASLSNMLMKDGWQALSAESEVFRSSDEKACIRLVEEGEGQLELFLVRNKDDKKTFPFSEEGINSALYFYEQVKRGELASFKEEEGAAKASPEEVVNKLPETTLDRWEGEGGGDPVDRDTSANVESGKK